MGIIIIILNNKAIIFGYSVNNSFRSILASISVILTTLSIYSLLKKAVKINMKIVLTGIISFILLIMGTRMYFMLYLLSYSVFLEVEYKFTRKNKTKCILLIIVVFILLAVISLKRLNQNIDIKIGIINNLKEFLYTSLSYASYFANNKIKYISFFGDNYIFHSPLGAMNIFTSLYGGFGLIGTVIILKGLSFLLNYLSNTNNKILKTWYFILCGGLLFIFYRDPMRIYFIKVGFQYSILILIIAKFISSFLKNYKSN